MKIFVTSILSAVSLSLTAQYKHISLEVDEDSLGGFALIEQIDLRMDQDYYLAGELINYSFNTVDAVFQLPVTFSAIAYVELYTQDNQVVAQQKVRMKDGWGHGTMQIPKTLQTNYYYIRAYTNYMKNYGPAFYYAKRIGIVNAFYPVSYQQQQDPSGDEYLFHIYPEGGKLIPGRTNELVYYAWNGMDHCREIAGRVVDERDSIVLRTSSSKPVTAFSLTPEAGRQYRFEALVCDEPVSVDLPVAHDTHQAILVDSIAKNNAFLNIVSGDAAIRNMKFTVTNHGIRYHSGYIGEQHKIKVSLPSGINVVQLLSDRSEVLATRLIAIDKQHPIHIVVDEDPVTKGKRQSLKLHITTTDENGQPMNSKLDISVRLKTGYDKNTGPSDSEPVTYASGFKRLFPNKSAAEYMPLMSNDEMFRHYLLVRSLDTISFQYMAIEKRYEAEVKYDIITGTVIDEDTGEPVAGQTVYQSFVDPVAWLNIDVTDEAGRFELEVEDEHAGHDLVFLIRDTSRHFRIDMDDEFSPGFVDVQKEVFRPDKSLKDEIQKRMVHLQVQDAYHSETERQVQRSPLRFYGLPDRSYSFDDYIKLPTLEEFAFEIVAGAVIQRENKKIHIHVVSGETNRIIGRDPLYLIDGVPVFDKDMVALIPPEVMDSFHVVTSRYFYKTLSFDGIIDLTSKKGDFSDFNTHKNSYRTSFVPVQTAHNRAGLDSSALENHLPYYATTLYSNAAISTGSNGKAAIEFTTPDNKGIYSIIIHARNEKGESGYLELPGFIRVE